MWGMSYKMSLYQPELAALSHTAQAKFSSENECGRVGTRALSIAYAGKTDGRLNHLMPILGALQLIMVASWSFPYFLRNLQQSLRINRDFALSLILRPPPVILRA